MQVGLWLRQCRVAVCFLDQNKLPVVWPDTKQSHLALNISQRLKSMGFPHTSRSWLEWELQESQ